ncbi:uncharacterized protein MKZ38_003718 [Zalerion maritima]|uniref:Uncharacterized protein n=1 Tax=Zalerion maritima TaxID=339359 RepID=A0AAD5WUJ9_9PEZI|nr:uncharacterized protein MKZ38_003718 [Zalerion maritima]
MPSHRDFFVLKTLHLPSRLGLSNNAQVLLLAYDEYRRGLIDSAELGRQVRLSPNKRQAITNTIAKCASYMRRKPEEVKNCIDILQTCTEILSIAGEVVGRPRYPVYNKKSSTCHCTKHEKPSWYNSHKFLNLGIASTSKAMNEEVMKFFYKNYRVDFSCTCEMLTMLDSNKELRENIRSVRVYWVGKVADTAFIKLAECPELRKLTLLISRSTTNKLNKREEELAEYFSSRRSTRVTEALGLDELLTIRGLTDVDVQHVSLKVSERRSDDEKASLTALLVSRLMQPRV